MVISLCCHWLDACVEGDNSSGPTRSAPRRLAGYSDFAPSLIQAPEESSSLACMLFARNWPCSRKVNPIIGVKARCHSFRPVSAMQSHDISTLGWSYSLPLRIHHCHQPRCHPSLLPTPTPHPSSPHPYTPYLLRCDIRPINSTKIQDPCEISTHADE